MIAYSMVSMDFFFFLDDAVVITDSGVNLLCMCLCVWSIILPYIFFSLECTTTNTRCVHNFHCDLHVIWILFRLEYWLNDERWLTLLLLLHWSTSTDWYSIICWIHVHKMLMMFSRQRRMLFAKISVKCLCTGPNFGGITVFVECYLILLNDVQIFISFFLFFYYVATILLLHLVALHSLCACVCTVSIQL